MTGRQLGTLNPLAFLAQLKQTVLRPCTIPSAISDWPAAQLGPLFEWLSALV